MINWLHDVITPPPMPRWHHTRVKWAPLCLTAMGRGKHHTSVVWKSLLLWVVTWRAAVVQESWKTPDDSHHTTAKFIIKNCSVAVSMLLWLVSVSTFCDDTPSVFPQKYHKTPWVCLLFQHEVSIYDSQTFHLDHSVVLFMWQEITLKWLLRAA